MAAFEVLLVNSSISNLIREGKVFQIPSIMQTQKGHREHHAERRPLLPREGGPAWSPREAYIKSVDKVGLKSLFERHKIEFSMDVEKPA